jgi:hypothetical protein
MYKVLIQHLLASPRVLPSIASQMELSMVDLKGFNFFLHVEYWQVYLMITLTPKRPRQPKWLFGFLGRLL